MHLFGSPMSVFCCQSSPIDVLITPWTRLKPCTPKHWCELSTQEEWQLSLQGEAQWKVISGPIVTSRERSICPLRLLWQCLLCWSDRWIRMQSEAVPEVLCVLGGILHWVLYRNVQMQWIARGGGGNPTQTLLLSREKLHCFLLQKQNWQPLEKKASFGMVGQMTLLFKH